MAYIGNSPGVASQRVVTNITATAGQTVFTPISGYTLGYVEVYQNGLLLVSGTDYTADDGQDITFAQGANLDDDIQIVAYQPRGLTDGYTKAEADARYEPLDSAYTKAESDSRYTTTSYVDTAVGNVTTDLVGDTTPQLGGNLDLNSNDITGTGNINVTGTVTADGLTVDGDVDVQSHAIDMGDNTTSVPIFTYNTNPTTSGATIGQTAYEWNGTKVVAVEGKSGNDTTNKDNGIFQIRVAESGNLNSGGLFVLDHNGNAGIGTSSPNQKLTIDSGALAFSGNTSTPTTSVGIHRPATDTLAFITNVAERMRIDSSGRLLLGTTTADIHNSSTEEGVELQEGRVHSNKSSGSAARFNRLTNDGTIVEFRKDGSTVGSIGVSGGDLVVHGTASSHSGFRFIDNGIVPTNNVGGDVDNSVDLGSISKRFDDIYATNGTIQTSDRNEKQDIAELSEAEQRVAVAAKSLMRKFRWKDAVAEKGDDARIHFGIIAQDLQAAFEAEGLDAGRYAMFIHSAWTDEETGEERSRMGVRYSELLAFIIAAI